MSPEHPSQRVLIPQPEYHGRQRRWRLSELLSYEAALAGKEPPKLDPEDEVYLTAAQVRRRYGTISDMTLWRWCRAGQQVEAA